MSATLLVVVWAAVAGAAGSPSCETEATKFKSVKAKARWIVHLDGTVEIEPSPDPIIVFDAPNKGELFVSVEAAGGRQLLCGKVTPGALYEIPLKLDDTAPATLLTVTMSGAQTGEEEERWRQQGDAVRSANWARTTLIEHQAVDNALGLPRIVAELNEYSADWNKRRLDELKKLIQEASTQAAKSSVCGPGSDGSPSRARCGRADDVLKALGKLMEQLATHTAPPKNDMEAARRRAEIDVAVAKLETKHKVSLGEIQKYCAQTAPVLRWFDDPRHAVLNVVQFPLGGAGTTVHRIVWKGGKKTFKGQEPESTVSFIISSVPHGTEMTVEVKERTGSKKDVADVLAGFLAVVLKKFPDAKYLESFKHFGFNEAWDQRYSQACEDLEPKQPATVVPLEPYSSRAYTLTEMPAATVDVLFCEGKTCPKDISTVTRAEVRPTASPSWTILAEVGFNGAITTEDPGWTMGDPQFESTGGASGPETLFELRYPRDVRRLFTGSLLIGSRFCDDKWFVGGGPTLLVGSGGGALTQLNARLGRQLSRGLYLTFGGGVRFVPTATDYKPGDLIAVTGTAGTAKAPESFRTTQTLLPVVSLGLSFDLGVLGSAADSLVASMGATK